MKNATIVLIFFFTVLMLGCGDDPAGPDDVDYSTVTDISYSQHVQVILTDYEGILEAAGIFPQGLQVDSWDNLIKGWRHGEVIIPFDADNSLLIELTDKLANSNELRDDKLDLLRRWINAGAQNDNGQIPYQNSNNRLYVCSQDAATVSVIDTEALVVIRTINLLDLGIGLSETSKPHHVAVEPDVESWYLSLIGENKVLKFNKNNELVGQTDTPIPALLAAHPTNGLLYISRFPQVPGMPPPSRVGVINRSTMLALSDIPVRPVPHAMAADNSGSFVYTCSLSESEVVVINPATNETIESVDLGTMKGPLQLAVSPDDQTLAVSNQISNEMTIIDVSDPANRTIVATVPVNKQPWHPVFTPDGSRVYVGNNGDNTVTVLNTATNSVIETVGDGSGSDGLAEPHGIAVSKNGQYIFVSNRNISGAYQPHYDFRGVNANVGTVVVINTTTNEITKVIEVEDFGSGMAIWEE